MDKNTRREAELMLIELADRMENACDGFKFRIVEIEESEDE